MEEVTVQDPNWKLLPFNHLLSIQFLQVSLSCQMPSARELEKHILLECNFLNLCLVQVYFKC